jgi:hypothetical protein
MAIELNHTIVSARDKIASAKSFARIFGLRYEAPESHFAPVRVNESLILDFDDRHPACERTLLNCTRVNVYRAMIEGGWPDILSAFDRRSYSVERIRPNTVSLTRQDVKNTCAARILIWTNTTARLFGPMQRLDIENPQFVVNHRWPAVKFEMVNSEPVGLDGRIRTRAAKYFGAQLRATSGCLTDFVRIVACSLSVLQFARGADE